MSSGGTSAGPATSAAEPAATENNEALRLTDLLTWLGQGKRTIAAAAALACATSLAVALLLPSWYTARTSLLPPGSQQQGGSAAALAALGSLGGLAGGLGAKTPDELYVALLKSDSVVRVLDERFKLQARYEAKNYEGLRRSLPNFIRISSDKKAGVINVEVDDKDPAFAAELANAHLGEVTKLLSRLAVSEAQQRRVFFERQLKETKENLVKAETDLRRVQEKSGVIALDKQAEALITGVAQVRSAIAEREVQLKVLRSSATAQNPDVMRLNTELQALRTEMARMESARSDGGGVTGTPVGKIPEVAVDYVRARRELKLQETLLESMVRQFELAKLDEAKEGPLLQQIDKAFPPDYKSRPSRAVIVLVSTLMAMLVTALGVIVRRSTLAARNQGGRGAEVARAWAAVKQSWRIRNS